MSIERLKAAIAWLDSYDPPSNRSRITLDNPIDNKFYEMCCGKEGTLLNLTDLRNILKEVG